MYWFDETAEQCIYTFDSGTISPLEVTDEAGVATTKGFTIKYESTEACTTDASKKFTYNLVGVCNADKTEDLTVADVAAGTGTSTIVACAQTTRVESKDACDFLVYGLYVQQAVDTLNAFFGIFCIGFGIAMVFFGLKIWKWVFRLTLFTLIFGVVFALLYNICSGASLGMQIGLACAAAVVGGLGAYCLDSMIKTLGVFLLFGMCGVYGGLFVATLAAQEGYAKMGIVVVCGGLGFLMGYMCSTPKAKVAIIATLCAAGGAGMLMYGLACEFGGFSVTTWSLYAYLAGGVVFAIGGAVLQMRLFRDEFKKSFTDEDGDGVNDNDVFDDDEGRICGIL